MTVTGRQVETGIKIMNLIFQVKRLGPSVNDVINHASMVSGLLANTSTDQETLKNAIVSRMVTIRAEVK